MRLSTYLIDLWKKLQMTQFWQKEVGKNKQRKQTLALAKGQVLASPQFKQLAGALAAANNYLGNGGTKVKVDTRDGSYLGRIND